MALSVMLESSLSTKAPAKVVRETTVWVEVGSVGYLAWPVRLAPHLAAASITTLSATPLLPAFPVNTQQPHCSQQSRAESGSAARSIPYSRITANQHLFGVQLRTAQGRPSSSVSCRPAAGVQPEQPRVSLCAAASYYLNSLHRYEVTVAICPPLCRVHRLDGEPDPAVLSGAAPVPAAGILPGNTPTPTTTRTRCRFKTFAQQKSIYPVEC